ncbi:hypothetical protein DS745_02970 [Anaerobacillus alkaliphilus]|uniref:Uncharacterized protein n=1 Tax=Anaerobacillus alkaliphilus TaxID=1548597 RepID=A0A4Q0VY68_9BACI|nr:hypothetical protein [Anaerobacillus alkaliphilus]RXJ04362.1 hypothetical protein DS745_02970 [Anaerobacillus alkaliphilus]
MFYFFYVFSCMLVGLLTLLVQRKKYSHLGFGLLRAFMISVVGLLLPNLIIFYDQVFYLEVGFHLVHYGILLVISITISYFISRIVIATE